MTSPIPYPLLASEPRDVHVSYAYWTGIWNAFTLASVTAPRELLVSVAERRNLLTDMAFGGSDEPFKRIIDEKE